MTKYRVPVEIKFDGCVEVEAEDEIEAEMIACSNVRASLANVHDNNCEDVLDYEIDHIGFAYLRDNESIEEVEEN